MPEQPEPPVAGELDLPRLVERVEAHLLGGGRTYTRTEVAEHSGATIDEVRTLWRALGFATADDDEQQVFTTADVEAVRGVRELQALGGMDDETLLAMTRIIGQTFARLASWQGQMTMDLVAERPELIGGDGTGLLELMDGLTPLTSHLHDYVWRRQLSAFFARVASNLSTQDGLERRMAVGFADMADFTTFTRRSSEADLRTVLGAFETLANDVVAANHGQIVKAIGDEILFTADTVRDGAEIALRLIEAADAAENLPQLRAGVAFGPVVSRLGDVYGQTVNIASRLTSVARTGSVLVDVGASEALDGDADFTLSPLRSVSVRGYHHLRSWRLRHAAS